MEEPEDRLKEGGRGSGTQQGSEEQGWDEKNGAPEKLEERAVITRVQGDVRQNKKGRR